MFWKIAVWTQSATDDPGFYSSFHETSDSPPMKGISASVQRICRRFSKFVYVDVYVGKCLLTSCERVIQKKTLNPFVFDTIRLDALLQ